jgi:heptaprenyl diphosphate synthase
MSALALIFSYVEAIIPYSPGVPGIKLGIANIVTVIALYRLSAKHAAGVNAIRIVVAGLLFNGVFAMLYSLAGAALSLTGMILAKRTGLFSTSGVSMIGGVLHNLGQIIVAAILIDDIRMFYYFPVLIISGLICGVVIGVVAQIVIDRLDRAAL